MTDIPAQDHATQRNTTQSYTQNPRERTIEAYLTAQAKDRDVLCYKFSAASVRGVPDRVLIGHTQSKTPLTIFVELKRPGEKPRLSQKQVINTMIEHGAYVVVLSTKEEIDRFFATTYDA